MEENKMKSTEFLQAAIDVQAERGQTYDKPTGERSMGATVTAFNAITGRDLSEAEGWLLLQTLKDVRQWQNPSKYHHDSALDGVAYSALKAEALSQEVIRTMTLSCEAWDEPVVINVDTMQPITIASLLKTPAGNGQ
jgi:hypothetical protein